MRYDFDNIGMFGGYDPRRKFWVAAAVGAAIGLGSTIFGASESARKEKEAKEKELQGYLSKRSYLHKKEQLKPEDTAEGSWNKTTVTDIGNANFKKREGKAAVGGATDASVAQGQESDNRMKANAIGQYASGQTARKDRIGEQIMGVEGEWANNQASHLRQQGANIAATASAAGNAIGSGLSGLEGSGAKSGVDASKGNGVHNPNLDVSKIDAPMKASESAALGSNTESDDAKKRALGVFNSWK